MTNTNDIIKNNHYPAYVLASAGTGKTELIARKVENLVIDEGVDIDKIALITFTNKATSETLSRIKSKIYSAWENGNTSIRNQIDKLRLAKISTIHIFCDNIIREFSYEIGLCPNYRISNLTLEKDKLANEIIKENFDEQIFEIIPMYRVVRLLKDIEEKASDKGLLVNLEKVREQNIWDRLRNYFYRVYPIYTQRLEELKLKIGAITTNDLIKYAVKILQNKKIAPYIINSLEYMFLDEAQDINYDQAYLMELLITYGVKVFVVGGEKQSIYAFRGSDKNAFNHLIEFIKKHKGIQYKLETNFRSNAFIIEKVNNLFDKKFTYKKMKLDFNNQKLIPNANAQYLDKSVSVIFQHNISDIINILREKEAVELKDIAVLCRTNREVMSVYGQLKRANIPVQSYISKSIYKSKIVIDLIKTFNYLAGGGNLQKSELFYTDLLIASKYGKIKEDEFYDRIDNLIPTLKSQGVFATLIQVLEDTFIYEYYTDFNNKQGLANIQRFVEIVRDLENDSFTSMEIVNFLNLMVVTGQEENQPQTNQDNSVTVSTIHTFKGLDSKVVIGYEIEGNLNSDHFANFDYSQKNGLSFNKDTLIPSLNFDKDIRFEIAKTQIIKDNLEEELRLLYVLMTRAKDRIILSSTKELSKMKYRATQDDEYVSYLRWIYEF